MLPESAFEVDADLLGIIEKKTAINIEHAKREMAWRLERAEIILGRLEKRYSTMLKLLVKECTRDLMKISMMKPPRVDMNFRASRLVC